MDLLFQRYASPFLFLNGMLQTGRFCEFVESFTSTVVEEKNEKTQWEYFLHKVWDGSFSEFKEGIKVDQNNKAMSANEIETTVQNSLSILKNFNPDQKGVI